MSATIYPLRLSAAERRMFDRSASSEKKKLSEWLRAAAHDRVRSRQRRAACLDYPDKIQLNAEAEMDPKNFLRKKLARKRELHR